MAREYNRPAGGLEPDARSFLDLAIVVVTLVVVKQSLLPISYLYAGPASTFTAVVLASFLLSWRGSSWGQLGLRRGEGWLQTGRLTILVVFLFLLATQLAKLVADQLFEDVGASGRFDFVEGDIGAYAGVMLLVWTHGSLFEELLFRAFFISKASRSIGGGTRSDWIAVALASVFFGYRHYYYQGMHGALVTGIAGLVFGGLYLRFGRDTIVPLVLAHGLLNSLAQTRRFFGVTD